MYLFTVTVSRERSVRPRRRSGHKCGKVERSNARAHRVIHTLCKVGLCIARRRVLYVEGFSRSRWPTVMVDDKRIKWLYTLRGIAPQLQLKHETKIEQRDATVGQVDFRLALTPAKGASPSLSTGNEIPRLNCNG
ncbi:hypothetical protein EVAR_41511_1 [Eumeta japonica]|uniref:Uncharacterized protein n=1 Tax=Eumeta variegata TaxID=151549 RepID=A0A4C1X4F0_EUMVA|nr:hypothetical protein EVAR_41511_1 [Eumeta japonica]